MQGQKSNTETVEKSLSTDTKTLELISRLQKGDGLAFEEINEKYRTVIESASVSVLRSVERAGISVGAETLDDLRQEARLALYRAATRYDPDGDGKKVTFGLYAKICVRNALVSELRRMNAEKRRADRAAAKLVSDGGERPSSDNTLGLFSQMKLEAVMEDSRRVLSRYEQRVLNEYISGSTIPEIAEELNKPQKSVNNALYRIRVKLRSLADAPDAKF